jgi:hypothetical protein
MSASGHTPFTATTTTQQSELRYQSILQFSNHVSEQDPMEEYVVRDNIHIVNAYPPSITPCQKDGIEQVFFSNTVYQRYNLFRRTRISK